jgi:hypothetical protein
MVERSRYFTDFSFITDLSHLEVSVGQSVSRGIHLFIVLPCAVSSTIAFVMPLCSPCLYHHHVSVSTRWTALYTETFVQVDIHMNHAVLTPSIFLSLNLYHPGIGDFNLPIL